MLKVLPVQDKALQETLCKQFAVPYYPEAMAYHATAEDKSTGFAQFSIDGEGGHILTFTKNENSKTEDLFVLGRAVLNFLDLCHIKNAFWEADFQDEKLISAIGFDKVDGKWQVALENFFIEPCKHHPFPIDSQNNN